jgi:hypothetical protein
MVKYNISKILDHNEVMLFQNMLESDALKLIGQLIEQYANNLTSEYPDITEYDAMNIAEAKFLLIAVDREVPSI